jgi:hypothetical protein
LAPAEYFNPGTKEPAFRRLKSRGNPFPVGLFGITPAFQQSIFPGHQADLPNVLKPTKFERTLAGCEQQITGDTTMFTNTKIALAAALILGTASAALANDNDETGGFVLPNSMDGVNPAYHHDIFGNAGTSRTYGFTAWPAEQEDRSQSGKKGRNR